MIASADCCAAALRTNDSAQRKRRTHFMDGRTDPINADASFLCHHDNQNVT
jgi:hypothetical protein